MSPEYLMRGQYSTKSDVFSFGVLVIEIVTGQRNSGNFFYEQSEDIISSVSTRPAANSNPVVTPEEIVSDILIEYYFPTDAAGMETLV
jgi:serine/threonine protein kinase